MLSETIRGLVFLVKILISVIFAISIAFILLAVLPICALYRQSVWIIAKICQPELTTFVSGLDATLTTDNPGEALSNITICLVVDGNITLKSISEMFLNVLKLQYENGNPVYVKLQQSYEKFGKYLFWKTDLNFKIHNYVRLYDYKGELALPTICLEADLAKSCSKLAYMRWCPGRSPWEFLIFNNYFTSKSSTPKTILMFRFDHVLTDGHGVFNLFRDLFRIPIPLPPMVRSKWQPTWRYAMIEGWKSLMDVSKSDWIASRPTDGSRECSANEFHFVYSPAVPVDLIKKIKKLHGVPFLPIVLSAILGAFHRSLTLSGKTPPKKISLIYPLGILGRPERFCNFAYSVLTPFFLEARSPKERLLATTETYLKTEHTLPRFLFPYIARCMDYFPTSMVQKLTHQLTKRKVFLGATIFSPSTEPMYINGFDVQEILASGLPNPSLNTTAGTIALGVNGHFKFWFFAAHAFLPADVATKLPVFFIEEMQALICT